ncbi:uncharacterized protein EV420DRAFT_1502670 [Desarmillaria tabescens]|uniref:Uncharacterized protein n=1 Tax=Armillaria tabescens TaxID=1929756 RepID=A0AA39NLX4_ARMTA|nr:uncharacterized protein EV420DRAFT_1502670 [Desarmillaria tabescens]KAK0468069.1 hypothetical protein EV420DRAFT_1502670 [Desarmillaria tabescens]
MTTSLIHDLLTPAIDTAKAHQYALTQYADALSAELDELDKLLKAAERDKEDGDEVLGVQVQVVGANKPMGPVASSELVNPSSPFYEESKQRMQYLAWTTLRPMKAKELAALDKGVKNENTRLKALQTRERGSSDIDITHNTEGINWAIIAEKVSDASTAKWTADEVEFKWMADKHPRINHGEWTDQEIEHLKVVAQETKVDWVQVAKDLGTNRIPLDCMRKAIQLRQRPKYAWKKRVDDRLEEAVGKYGVANWSLVARYVANDLNAVQCEARYVRLHLNRSPWTEAEDARLDLAVAGYGQSWVDVASAMPGRTNDQCRDRWIERQKVASVWTEDDDRRLVELVDQFGTLVRWKAVASEMGGGRTDVNCRLRHNKIKPTPPPEAQKKAKAKEKEKEKENPVWKQPPTYALSAPVSAAPPSAGPVLTTWALNPRTRGNQAVPNPAPRAWPSPVPQPPIPAEAGPSTPQPVAVESDAMDVDPVVPQQQSKPKGRRKKDANLNDDPMDVDTETAPKPKPRGRSKKAQNEEADVPATAAKGLRRSARGKDKEK